MLNFYCTALFFVFLAIFMAGLSLGDGNPGLGNQN